MKYWILLLFPLFILAVPQPPRRPSKAPFVSGDAFRAISDHCYDEVTKSMNPAIVQEGDTIFVKTDYLDSFFKKVHPFIAKAYVLITHNSDDAAPGSFAAMLDDAKILAWFGQNYDGTPHPKMHPIPIGIANFCWPYGNADVFREIHSQQNAKMHLAHMAFSYTHPERHVCVRHLAQEAYCYRTGNKPFRLYALDVASAKFEIAPRGNGIDTHRFWESLYLGTIPIVTHSTLDGLYEDLPVLIIDDWAQVTADFLLEKHEELNKTGFRLDKLWMDYWIKLINSYQSMYKSNPLH